MTTRDELERQLAADKARKNRRISQELCDRARHLANFYPLNSVAVTLDLSPSQLTRMKRRGWQALPPAGVKAEPVPDDFAERLASMTAGELAVHYRKNGRTIAKWRKATPGAAGAWGGEVWETRRERYGPRGIRVQPGANNEVEGNKGAACIRD